MVSDCERLTPDCVCDTDVFPPVPLTDIDCEFPDESDCVDDTFLPFFSFFAGLLLPSTLPMLIDCELLQPDWLCEMFCAQTLPPAARAAAAARVSALFIAFPSELRRRNR